LILVRRYARREEDQQFLEKMAAEIYYPRELDRRRDA